MRFLRSAFSTFSLVSSSSPSPSRGGGGGGGSAVPLTTTTTTATATATTTTFTSHARISELVDRYDAFILDQFGVLHNGVTALSGAVECVAALHQAGKRLIILSNTSAPAEAALHKLPKFGFDVSHMNSAGAVTSGQEAAQFIRQQYCCGRGPNNNNNTHKNRRRRPARALMLTWDARNVNNPRLTALPEQFLAECADDAGDDDAGSGGNTIALATCVDEADFLLLHGSEVWYRGPNVEPVSLYPFITQGSLENVEPLLRECSRRNLPMVCANPDNVVLGPDGNMANMPGKLATKYAELLLENNNDNNNNNNNDDDTQTTIPVPLPANCRIFGKPHVEHFHACLQKLRAAHGIAAHRVAHVGDSLHHDIAGASAAGISSIWTASSGIHAADLNLQFGDEPTDEAVRDLLERQGTAAPTHVVPAFVW